MMTRRPPTHPVESAYLLDPRGHVQGVHSPSALRGCADSTGDLAVVRAQSSRPRSHIGDFSTSGDRSFTVDNLASSFTRNRVLGLSLLLALVISACGASVVSRPSLVELRARASQSPGDGRIQGALALSEMFDERGDLARARAPLDRAVRAAPADIRLQLLSGIYRELYGEPEGALEAYLKTIELAVDSTEADAVYLSEVATHLADALLSGGTRGAPQAFERAERVFAHRSQLAAPARFALGELLIERAYRKGDLAAVKRIAQALGCVTEWKVAGPFGPRSLLDFDRPDRVSTARPLQDRYDLGPGRGLRETATYQARGCRVHLGGGAVDGAGTRYAQAAITVSRPADYLIRLATPNSFVLYIDGKPMGRVDRRAQISSPESYLPVTLNAGQHLLTVKVTTRSLNPILSLAWSRVGPIDQSSIRLPEIDPYERGPEATYRRYLRASIALSRADAIAARETYRTAGRSVKWPPVIAVQQGGIALSDPLLPDDVRRDEARRLFEASLRQTRGLWSPLLQLASNEAENGRLTEAIEKLREAITRWPRVRALYATLFDLLQRRGWNNEAEVVVKKWREQLPVGCALLNAELSVANHLRKAAQSLKIAEALVQCDARSNAKYAELLRQRRWDEASAELGRLTSLEPPQNDYGILLARLELAKSRGDIPVISETIERLRHRYPRSNSALLEQLDWLYARGNRAQAEQVFTNGYLAEPSMTLAASRMQALISGAQPLDAYRVNGAEVIAQFERSGRTYDQPQVLVFDYLASRIYPDGSSIQLVHNIHKVQSAEAVNELGEFQLPEGARLLTLRTIKADGQRLEPDQIEGKDTLSLPNLVPGDYTEFEYVRVLEPPEAFPSGYLGERFYFRSFEIPFDTSHMILLFSPDAAVTIDPRDTPPVLKEALKAGLREMSWKVQGSAPLVAEPLSVSAREFLPSVNVGVGATWERLVEGLRDLLADRDVFDPEMRDLALQIVGPIPETEPVQRAERIYAWVVENIENTNEAFAQAAVMTRARSGNRARVLHYLLDLAGVRSKLALVKSIWDDATPSELAEPEVYDNLLVLVEPSSTWLSTADRFAPFGYIPQLFRGQSAIFLQAGARMGEVRPSNPGEDRQSVALDVQMRADGSATVRATEQYWGEGAVAWRQRLQAIPSAELEKRFEQDHLPSVMPGAVLKSMEIAGRENPALPLQLDYTFDVNAAGRRSGDFWALAAIWPIRFSASYAQRSKRDTTALIAPAVDRELSMRVTLPAGLSFVRLPGKASVKGPTGTEFSQGYRRDGKTVLIEQRIRVPLVRVNPAAYAPFADFCRAADQAQANEIWFSAK
jgi:cellulose synthase operon protein C